mmetsp:Transcript_41264/g.131184  ORF Transcript_41264/g.131184 Transcript_41264/m.131184 type:complete len:202 (-) Transcript_41264:1295-1900(-)
MMQGPSPNSHSEPSTSTQSVKVAPALICTTPSRPMMGDATPMASVPDQAPRPSAEKGRQPKVQTRPRSVRMAAWASPTATSTATSLGGSMLLGSSEKPFVAPDRERPGLRQTKQRPSQVRATLKLAPRTTLREGGSSAGNCEPSLASAPPSCSSGAAQPPASCSKVADSVEVRAPAPSREFGESPPPSPGGSCSEPRGTGP